jgi:hypothetical protein
MANTATLSMNVVVADSVEVGRSALYSRRAMEYTHNDWGDFCVLCLTFMRK